MRLLKRYSIYNLLVCKYLFESKLNKFFFIICQFWILFVQNYRNCHKTKTLKLVLNQPIIHLNVVKHVKRRIKFPKTVICLIWFELNQRNLPLKQFAWILLCDYLFFFFLFSLLLRFKNKNENVSLMGLMPHFSVFFSLLFIS